jgi:hypothetical protein
VEEEALGRDLDDVAGAGAGKGGLEHRLVDRGVEAVADLGRDHGDAVLGEHVDDGPHRQVDALEERGVGLALLGRHSVVDRQEVAGELGRAVLLAVAAVAFGALADVLGFGELAQDAVLELVPLGAQGVELLEEVGMGLVLGVGLGGEVVERLEVVEGFGLVGH